MRGFLYTWLIIWVSTTQYYTDTRVILPRYGGFWIVYRPKWYQNKYILKYPYKNKILNIFTQLISKQVIADQH